MATKTKTVEVKAAIDDNGYIKGYASTWTREPDFVGDVVAKGAFAESIARLKESGETLPLLFNHNCDDLDSYIGKVDLLEEDEHGLLFGAPFDNTEKAQRARELAQDGRLSKFSFAYDVLDQAPVTLADGRKANELRKLNIHEVSLVLNPCNPDTSVIDVKSADEGEKTMDDEVKSDEQVIAKAVVEITPVIKSGRRNSAKDADELRKVQSAANQILEVVNGLLADDEAETTDEVDEGEAEKSAEGASSQAAFVDAYKQAIKLAIGD